MLTGWNWWRDKSVTMPLCLCYSLWSLIQFICSVFWKQLPVYLLVIICFCFYSYSVHDSQIWNVYVRVGNGRRVQEGRCSSKCFMAQNWYLIILWRKGIVIFFVTLAAVISEQECNLANVNPLQPGVAFLYPLKTSENL